MMTFSSFFGRKSAALVGCDEPDLWKVERFCPRRVGDEVKSFIVGRGSSPFLALEVERTKNGVRSTFSTKYDDTDAADFARAEREVDEWLEKTA